MGLKSPYNYQIHVIYNSGVEALSKSVRLLGAGSSCDKTKDSFLKTGKSALRLSGSQLLSKICSHGDRVGSSSALFCSANERGAGKSTVAVRAKIAFS